MNTQPIAVFDSGLGGLSVVRHLRQLLPAESIVYFGDTARVPYGSKSRPTVAKFAAEAAQFLMQFDPKLLVAACNTVSALALDELAAATPVPVVGVVEPGARAAAQRGGRRPIAVIGTEATVNSGAYTRAIHAVRPDAQVIAQACPLFVPLVEEGRDSDDPIVALVSETYLAPLRAAGAGTVVLGCTHYPLLRDAISRVLGGDVEIIDSGRETSRDVHALLMESDRLSRAGAAGSMRCFVSDNPARFRCVGSRFLEHEIDHVEHVEPEHYITPAL